jgi:hypothetical protein
MRRQSSPTTHKDCSDRAQRIGRGAIEGSTMVHPRRVRDAPAASAIAPADAKLKAAKNIFSPNSDESNGGASTLWIQLRGTSR